MKAHKPYKILKFKAFVPNTNNHHKGTGKFETVEEAISCVKNYLVDVMMDDQDGWARKEFVDYKITKEEKDNIIIFKLSGKERLTSGHIKMRETLVTRIIKPIEWELIYK